MKSIPYGSGRSTVCSLRLRSPVVLALSTLLVAFLTGGRVPEANGAIKYVVTNGNDLAVGTNWATAKQTIQAAVDVAAAGDTVLVSNGVYATGLRVTPGYSLSNRVVFSGITVQSVNGAEVTTIVGGMDPGGVTNGNSAVRCVYMGANSVLSGFTLSNGHSRVIGNATYEQRGGAVYCEDVTSVLSNCIVRNSSAINWGGGSEGGTFNNCLFTGNWAGQGGGGADSSILNNCTLSGNTGPSGGGATGGTLFNCIVYANSGSGVNSNYYLSTINSSCTAPAPGGTGNIVSDPQFANAAGGNFSLQATSPCINTGNNGYAPGTNDLAGSSRITGGTVDMGAYEFPGPFFQSITSFPNPGDQYTNSVAHLSATASSGLAVTFAVGSGPGSISNLTNVLFTATTGRVSVVASQAGNSNWLAAASLTNSFNVLDQPSSYIVTVVAGAGGTASGGGSYLAGSNIVISASPTNGHWFFWQWNDANTSPSRTITVPSSNITYTATFTQSLAAFTFYVATNGSDAADGHSWATAKQTIQAGVDLAMDGDTVLVSNGVYATGLRAAPGFASSNRVVITQHILVQSVGRAPTVIKGYNGGTWSLSDCVRCVFVTNGTLSGFTLTNGAAPHVDYNDLGGGVYAGNGTVQNCLITGCAAYWGGGGAIYGTYINCTIAGNSAGPGGQAGGVYGGTLYNCIVYSNSAASLPNWEISTFNYSCTTPAPGGTSNIISDPQFVNAAGGNYRLQATSPCLNKGSTNYVTASMTTDLDGSPRIVGGAVDMGAYEYQGGGATTSTVTVVVGPGGTATGGGSYLAGSNIVISASPTNGHWFFWQWNDANTSATRTVTVPATNVTYTATFTQYVGALTFYVATNGSDAADGHSWATAKQTIQAGVDQTLDGDTVLVSNGVYATGLRAAPGFTTSNRVVITRAILVQSIAGPVPTVIQGYNGGSYSNYDSVRCVFLTNSAVLSGFTLSNGCAPHVDYNDLGGGAYANGGTLQNCLITHCAAYDSGGGAVFATLRNCTVVGNSATFGGGIYQGTLNNCIVYSNSASVGPNYSGGGSTFNYSCTTPDPFGTSNVISDPQFVNAAAGNFRLQAGSPCINKGRTNYVTASMSNDLAGSPRIVGGAVDMGAYEYQATNETWLLTSGYGTNGSVGPASTNVAAGSNATFSVQANSYYRILDITTNGVAIGTTFNNDSTSTNLRG